MVFFKLFVFENVLIVVISNFVKIIHIKLSNEGTEIPMTKVNWQYILLKSLHITDNEV